MHSLMFIPVNCCRCQHCCQASRGSHEKKCRQVPPRKHCESEMTRQKVGPVSYQGCAAKSQPPPSKAHQGVLAQPPWGVIPDSCFPPQTKRVALTGSTRRGFCACVAAFPPANSTCLGNPHDKEQQTGTCVERRQLLHFAQVCT